MINVVPLYANIKDGRLIATENYKTERPELYENFQQMHASYKAFIRGNVEMALSDGYTVESIPFTPADDTFAKMILEGLPVTFNAYHSNPSRMIRKMAKADWVIATRFHATIFTLKLGMKISPIAYAIKNELMLQSLGLSKTSFWSSTDFADGKNELVPPVQVEASKIDDWEQASRNAIINCIQSLHIKR